MFSDYWTHFIQELGRVLLTAAPVALVVGLVVYYLSVKTEKEDAVQNALIGVALVYAAFYMAALFISAFLTGNL